MFEPQLIKRFGFLIILLCFINLKTEGQNDQLSNAIEIEESIESIIAANPDLSDAQLNEITERLNAIYQSKVDINTSDLRVFTELLLLNDIQIQAILVHRNKYGKYAALYELQTVNSIELSDIKRILPYLKPIGIEGVTPFDWNMLYKGNKTILARYTKLLQDQKGYLGDEPKYLGSNERYSIRFRHVVPGRVSIGFGMEKDAGEPFSRKYNDLFFDFTTFHIYLENVNKLVKRVVIGDFQASAGQGLILFSGYGFGKSAFTTAVKKNERSLRPSTSLNEINALRGAGVELNIAKNTSFMVFGSIRRSDGNAIIPDSIENDQEQIISSLQMAGLHRTLSEIEDKGYVKQITAGSTLKYAGTKFSIGINTVYDKLDKSLQPSDRGYNKYYFSGKEALNSSVDYTYFLRNVVLFGETAVNPAKSIATVNGALIGLHPKVSLALMFRHLPKEYYSLHGKVFSDQTATTNETGFYIGTEIKPSPRFVINAYADFYKHSWPTFQADGPSEGNSYLIKLSYQKRKKWDTYIQFRYQSEQVTGTNDVLIPALFSREKADIRFHFNRKVGNYLAWSSRFDYVHLILPGDNTENSYLMYQELWARPLGKPFSGFIRFAVFNVESYQSRIYSYEHYMAYDSRNLQFEGIGNRFVSGVRWKFFNGITIEASYNATKYSDRTAIGSGNDQILGNLRSEFRAQVRYGFGD